MALGQDTLFQLIGAGGAVTLAGTILNGVLSRKKLGADATDIIQKAAGGIVTRLETENERLTERADAADARVESCMAKIEDLQRKVEAAAEERRLWRDDLQLHAAWDAIAIRELATFGHAMPEAPPLYPKPPVRS